MTPDKISKRIAGDRLHWIDKMVTEISSLPLKSYDVFTKDSRNIWAAESCLRRTLEASFDIGRHILAKGYAEGVTEYKEIARELGRREVLSQDDVKLLHTLVGYRNRLVHFYHEVTTEELYRICKNELNQIFVIKKAYIDWLRDNSDMMDETL